MSEETLWNLCDNIKLTNVYIMRVPNAEKRKRERKYT
jgi:hypothetical protein